MGLIDSNGQKVIKDALIIRHTEIGSFRYCPRYWYITSQNGMNLEAKVKDKKLRFGTAWHRGLEVKLRDKVSILTGFKESWDEQVKEMENDLGQGFYVDEIQSELNEMQELGEKLGAAYDEWAETDANPRDSEMKVVSTERRLLVKIPQTRAWLAAKLDGIVEYMGGLWTLEHKTQSKSSKVDSPTNTNRDIQMGLQLVALKLAGYTKDTPLGGAIYNLARKQAPSNRVKNPLFGRHLVHYSEAHLDNLLRDLIIVHVPDMQKSRRNPMATMRRYNPGIGANSFCDWGCPAKEVCEAMNRSENVQYLVEQKFKKRDKEIRELLFEEMEE